MSTANSMLACGHPPPPNADITDQPVNCAQCDRRQQPAGLREARRTPTFDATTVPPALLNDHHTTAWALLVVSEGRVEFTEPATPWHDTATPQNSISIVPRRVHHIRPSTDARFHVRFYSAT